MLRDIADKLLEENRYANNGPHSVSMLFVGTDGIVLKTTTMDAVKAYPDLEGEGAVLAPSSQPSIVDGTYGEDNDKSVSLPKIHIIAATKSARSYLPHLSG